MSDIKDTENVTAVEDMQKELKAISDVNDTLIKNRVARFAYTQEAYNENIADGVAEYKVANQQNIPIGTEEVLNVNSTVLSKGYRSQASSLTRNLMNHFLGRLSYNANKIADNVKSMLDFFNTHIGNKNGIATLNENGSVERTQLKDYNGTANGFATLDADKTLEKSQIQAYLGSQNGIATLDETGRIPFEQLPESALELKGTWDAEKNVPEIKDGVGTNGDMYIVSTSGTQNLGHGDIFYQEGNRILYTTDTNEWTQVQSGSVFSVAQSFPDAQGNVALGDLKFEVVDDETVASVGTASVSFKDDNESGTVKVASNDTDVTVGDTEVSVNVAGNKAIEAKGTEDGIEVNVDANTTLTGSVHINADSDSNGNIVIGKNSLQNDLTEDKGNKGNIIIGSNSLVNAENLENAVSIGEGNELSDGNGSVVIGNNTVKANDIRSNYFVSQNIIIGNNNSEYMDDATDIALPHYSDGHSWEAEIGAALLATIPVYEANLCIVMPSSHDDDSRLSFAAFRFDEDINSQGDNQLVDTGIEDSFTGVTPTSDPRNLVAYSKEKNILFFLIPYEVNRLYYTKDRGKTWSSVSTSVILNTESTNFDARCVSCSDDLIVLGDEGGNLFYATFDTFEDESTWGSTTTLTDEEIVWSIKYCPKNKTFVISGNNGIFYATYSIGITGNIVFTVAESEYSDRAAASPPLKSLAVGIGEDGEEYVVTCQIEPKQSYIFYSTDGGKNFTVINSTASGRTRTYSGTEITAYNDKLKCFFLTSTEPKISGGSSVSFVFYSPEHYYYTYQYYSVQRATAISFSKNCAYILATPTSAVTISTEAYLIETPLTISIGNGIGTASSFKLITSKEAGNGLGANLTGSFFIPFVWNDSLSGLISGQISDFNIYVLTKQTTFHYNSPVIIGNDIQMLPFANVRGCAFAFKAKNFLLTASLEEDELLVNFEGTWEKVLTSSTTSRAITYTDSRGTTESVYEHVEKLAARIDELEAQIATGSSATGFAASTNAKIQLLESSISKAQSTADSAVSAAASAQSTANSAVSKADSANTALGGYSFT